MNKTDSNKKNQQACKKCGRIVGVNYRGKKHKCDCQPTCGDCSHFKYISKYGQKASLDCEIVGYGTQAKNNPCDRFKEVTS